MTGKRSLFLYVFVLIFVFSLVGPLSAQGDLMSLAAPDCNYGGNFLSVEALDNLTVKFTLCNPDPAFATKVAFTSFNIQSSDYLEATGGGGDLVTAPIGTGPYKLDHWDRGNEIVFTRNEDYWGEPAKEPTLIFHWKTEAAQRLIDLQAGIVDGIDNPGEGDFDVIENDPNLVLYKRSGANVLYLGLNNLFPPLDNQTVRDAVAYAIDKQRLIDNFFPPGSIVADQFMPPAIFGYTKEVQPFPYDPQKAIDLLQQAGLTRDADGNFFSIDLSYRDVVRPYLPTPGVVATDIQAQLAEVGIKVNINVMESGAFIDASDRGELAMFLLGWNADYLDATNFLDYHFGAGSTQLFGNHYPEITDVLAQAGRLVDQDARYQLYVQANTAPARSGSDGAYRSRW